MKKSLLTALGFVFASSAALAQTGGPDMCSPDAIAGVGVWAYDTSLPGTTESGLLTTGNPCNSAVPGYGSVDSMHKDVVYEWTVPAGGGTFQIDLCSTTFTNFDTKLAIYGPNADPANCADQFAAGAFLVCNEDGPPMFCANFSSLQILGSPCDGPLVAGDKYLIQCGGFDQVVDIGPAELTITALSVPAPPANDTCAGATALAMGPNAVSNVDACVSGLLASGLPPFLAQTEPDTACELFAVGLDPDYLGTDVYYTFSPPSSGDYRFATCDMASYDSKAAIYSGACGGLTALACNDDGDMCAAFSTELNVTGLSGGTSYIVQLGGFNTPDVGTATMEVSETFPPSLGTPFCPGVANSTGAASEMTASGSLSVAANDLVITANNLPGGQVGVFFYAPNQLNGGAGLPFGDGLRCAGGTVFRIFPPTPVVANAATKTVNNTLPSGAGIGAFLTQHFQFWYRDPGAGGAGFNLSTAMTLVFLP
jgi:hypothetical protein